MDRSAKTPIAASFCPTSDLNSGTFLFSNVQPETALTAATNALPPSVEKRSRPESRRIWEALANLLRS